MKTVGYNVKLCMKVTFCCFYQALTDLLRILISVFLRIDTYQDEAETVIFQNNGV